MAAKIPPLNDEYKRFYPLVSLTFVTLGIGVIFYHFVEKLSWIDALYFCVVTLATVGYGDITPQTDIGKLFTVFYILSGIGIIAAFASEFFKRRQQRYTEHKEKRREKNR